MSFRDDLLSIRARIDAILNRIPKPTREASSERLMSVREFAVLTNYSTRTIRDWCDLGMPHSGNGRHRRIHVAEAIEWIEARGPKRTKTD